MKQLRMMQMNKIGYINILNDEEKQVFALNYFDENLNEWKISDYCQSRITDYDSLEQYQSDMRFNYFAKFCPYRGRRILCFDNEQNVIKAAEYLEARQVLAKIKGDFFIKYGINKK
jgi:hypothetical protein